jgi:hypothetical protein
MANVDVPHLKSPHPPRDAGFELIIIATDYGKISIATGLEAKSQGLFKA